MNLPNVLSTEEENRLLSLLPSKKARELLIIHNLRYVLLVASKYAYNADEKENLFQVGVIGLIKAIDTYNRKKNVKLITYASWCIRTEILIFLRKEQKYINTISIYTPILSDYDGNTMLLHELLSDPNSSRLMDKIENIDVILQKINNISNIIFETSSKKSFRNFILFLYMLSGKKQDFLSKKFSLSQSLISRLFIKFRSYSSISSSSSNKIYFYSERDNNLYLHINNQTLTKEFELETFEFFADRLFEAY